MKLDFPILTREVNGMLPAYLDSPASSQEPRAVIDTIVDVYETSYAAVHRAVYTLGEVATERYEAARDTVAALLNAGSRREVIFVRNATEGLNLVAYAYGGKFLGPGDAIVSTEMEHHSNLVPWQEAARRTGADLHFVRLTDRGELDRESLDALSGLANIKLVAATHVSNSLGTVNDVAGIARWAHERGAVMVCDGAQAAPHRPVDVQALGCDFYAISGHKMCGPGIGALWGREDMLEAMDPFLTGGGQIAKVTLEGTTWNDLPYKFEPGVPPLAEAVGFGAAIDYLTGIGLEAIHEHEAAPDRVRLGAPLGVLRPSRSTGRRLRSERGSCRSRSRASTPTTSPRSSTPRACASAPAITARSRRCGTSTSLPRPARASTSTIPPTISIGSPPVSTRSSGRSRCEPRGRGPTARPRAGGGGGSGARARAGRCGPGRSRALPPGRTPHHVRRAAS